MYRAGLAACFLMAFPAIALAQPRGEEDFHREVIERLDRIERLLISGRPYAEERRGPRSEVVAAANMLCGTTLANCQQEAIRYCRTIDFPRGVPLDIEARNNFNYLTRVRCFE